MRPELPRIPRVILPLLSLLGVAFAVTFVVRASKTEPPPPPLVQPERNPFAVAVSGAGIVEPSAERTISVGPTTPGVVLEVTASVGDVVTAGAPLFRLDDRALVAEREVRRAALESARAKLKRLESLPRPEEVPSVEAKVEQADAAVADLRGQFARLEKAFKSGQGVVSVDELDQRRFRLLAAEKALEQSRAELALLEAGAWEPDLAQARAEVAQAAAALGATEVEIERARIRAPIDATVLEVHVRRGMYAQPRDELVLLGDVTTLHVRVDVDEESAPLVRERCRAIAYARGFPATQLPLEFVRIEPYIRPKKSLTGDNNERVDTRVLQVIFRLGRSPLPVYVGQLLDVFMEAVPREKLAHE